VQILRDPIRHLPRPPDYRSRAASKSFATSSTSLTGAATSSGASSCVWIRAAVPLQYYRQPNRSGHDLASVGKVPRNSFWITDKARAHHPTLGTPSGRNADTGWLDEITILHLALQMAGFDKPGGYVPLLSPAHRRRHACDAQRQNQFCQFRRALSVQLRYSRDRAGANHDEQRAVRLQRQRHRDGTVC
jgi:hypothetical protein